MAFQLPLEVWHVVFRYLPNADLATLSLASHRLSDAAIHHIWLRPLWRLDDADKILTAVTRRKQQNKRPRILVLSLYIELPISSVPPKTTFDKFLRALGGLIEMGVKVEQTVSVIWALQEPTIELDNNVWQQHKRRMKNLRQGIRSVFEYLVELADTSPLIVTDYESAAGNHNVKFWEWTPDIPITVAKFMGASGTYSEGAALFVYEHRDDVKDATTTVCNIRVIDFSSVKVLVDDNNDWIVDLPESVDTIVFHEEEVDRGSSLFFCGDRAPKICYMGSMGLAMWE